MFSGMNHILSNFGFLPLIYFVCCRHHCASSFIFLVARAATCVKNIEFVTEAEDVLCGAPGIPLSFLTCDLL